MYPVDILFCYLLYGIYGILDLINLELISRKDFM